MLNVLQQHQSDFAAALVCRQSKNEEFIGKLKDSSKISPQRAIDIYRNNTRGARIDALELVYPICKKILGNDIFRSIAREYVIANVEDTSDLNHYGKQINQKFQLLLDTGRLPEQYVYLPDLAKLEFVIHAAYYADNDSAFDFQLFEHKINNNESMHLKISASLGLLRSEYPVYEIWLNNQKQQAVKEIYAIDNAQYLLVHRGHYKPKVNIVSEVEYRLLKAFINGNSFHKVIKNSGHDIDKVLPKLIANRWVTGIK